MKLSMNFFPFLNKPSLILSNSFLKQTIPKTSYSTSIFDPLAKDLYVVKNEMIKLLDNPNIQLKSMSEYYLQGGGKSLRPRVLLLISKCLDSNQNSNLKQRKLAGIVELIHTSSLVHDDILDEAATRRGKPALNLQFSTKRAVLTGDYLLAKASLSLASLENHQVTSHMSTVLSDLVEGELMLSVKDWDSYFQKTFLKTATMFYHGCYSAALLSEQEHQISPELAISIGNFGKQFGMAFQITDDLLDYKGDDSLLGKPTSSDLSNGVYTAPVFYAAEESTEFRTLFERDFSQPGDLEMGINIIVSKSDALHKTQLLAEKYTNEALDNLQKVPPSKSKDLLVNLVNESLKRKN